VRATDLVVGAAAGPVALTGNEDRAPLRVGLPQAFHHAAADAVGAALIALYERDNHSGCGQFVDVSAQQSYNVASQSALLSHPNNASLVERVAGGVVMGGMPTKIQLLWDCADGQVSVSFLFGASIAPFTQNLMNWVHQEGFCDEATRDKDWVMYGVHLYTGEEPVAEYERIKEVLSAFFATKTKAELLAASFERRVLIAPVTTTADVLASEHWAARQTWDDVDMGPHGTVRYPGAFARFSATPLSPLPPARPLGADTAAVLAEEGRRPDGPRVTAVKERAPQPERPRRPLEGLKVADFTWVFAGPWTTRALADCGAEVVRVESSHRVDTLRTAGNFKDDETHPDAAIQYSNVNAGKKNLALDLSRPEARDVAIDLVKWGDITVESFSPRAMRGWGLDYDSLRAIRPDLIMGSSCLMGGDGPQSSLAGFGTMAAAISGFFSITGWPDRQPCGPFMAYTDYVAPRFFVAALLGALEHRRRTGEGQYIDLSQAECSMQLLAPALLETALTGSTRRPRWPPAG
jgi:crotonobetainyl-CoA:carnitine CoA-transferase CaiB-like acyl-CoA transferase